MKRSCFSYRSINTGATRDILAVVLSEFNEDDIEVVRTFSGDIETRENEKFPLDNNSEL